MTIKTSELKQSLIHVLDEPPKITVMIMATQVGWSFARGPWPGAQVWRAHFPWRGGNNKKGEHVSQVTGPLGLTGHRLGDSLEPKRSVGLSGEGICHWCWCNQWSWIVTFSSSQGPMEPLPFQGWSFNGVSR